MNYWLAWIGHSQYRGRWREMVNRSALTLKLLTSQPHGSIVAAPTFGLPESIGGERNWDYRYTWIRDASFTLYALMRLGYTEEATAFMGWIEQRCRDFHRGNPLAGHVPGRWQPRTAGNDLETFRGLSRQPPGAHRQRRQPPTPTGHLRRIAGFHLYLRQAWRPISYDFWMNLIQARRMGLPQLAQSPTTASGKCAAAARPFLYSRVLCWVAIDRAMQIARRRSFPAPLVRWHRIRDEIYKDIYEHFWNPKLKCFVQYRGAKTVDASALLMPLVKFISPTDPRWRSTLEAIENTLVEDSLVYRYQPAKAAPDGLPGREGTFSMCSFWYVECLARAGDLKQARFIFEKALGYANHLGLYAEQLGPCGEHLGNFPRRFPTSP